MIPTSTRTHWFEWLLLAGVLIVMVFWLQGCATFSNAVKDCGTICKGDVVKQFKSEDLSCECNFTPKE